MGVAPTGKTVTWTGISIDRFADGKIVERWTEINVLGVLQQIGAVTLT
jgi:predicted ester cyclase